MKVDFEILYEHVGYLFYALASEFHKLSSYEDSKLNQLNIGEYCIRTNHLWIFVLMSTFIMAFTRRCPQHGARARHSRCLKTSISCIGSPLEKPWGQRSKSVQRKSFANIISCIAIQKNSWNWNGCYRSISIMVSRYRHKNKNSQNMLIIIGILTFAALSAWIVYAEETNAF